MTRNNSHKDAKHVLVNDSAIARRDTRERERKSEERTEMCSDVAGDGALVGQIPSHVKCLHHPPPLINPGGWLHILALNSYNTIS